jgi:hypothetical protein
MPLRAAAVKARKAVRRSSALIYHALHKERRPTSPSAKPCRYVLFYVSGQSANCWFSSFPSSTEPPFIGKPPPSALPPPLNRGAVPLRCGTFCLAVATKSLNMSPASPVGAVSEGAARCA